MMRSVLFLVCPLGLLAADANRPVHFIEDSSNPRTRSFFAEANGNRVRIDQKGWYVENASRLQFAGMTRSARFEGLGPEAPVSYFVGRDPRAWIHGARSYKQLREANVYPGIDVVYHASEGGSIEYDFVVAPGHEPRKIVFILTGRERPRLDIDGSLVLPATSGDLKLAAPIAYQLAGQQRTTVACRYLVSNNRIRFEIGTYDRARTLVIDPAIVFARVTSGSWLQTLATDGDGNSYTGGSSPPTAGAYPSPASFSSPYARVSISKRDPNGELLWTANLGPVYSTLTSTPTVNIAVDGVGNVYVGGAATADFPVTADAFPLPNFAPLGGPIGFVLKLSPDGSQLLFSTLLWTPLARADGADQVTALAVSPEGQMTFAGTRFTAQRLNQGDYYPYLFRVGGVLARLSADGHTIVFSQALAGTVSVIALDPNGGTVVGGSSSQADAAPVSLQPTLADATAYISPDGGTTVYSVAGQPITYRVAIDPNNPLTVLRATRAGVFQSQDGGENWQSIDALGTGSFSAVWIHPRRPQLWFASPSESAGILFRSEDAGATWTSVSALALTSFFDDGTQILASGPAGLEPSSVRTTEEPGNCCRSMTQFHPTRPFSARSAAQSIQAIPDTFWSARFPVRRKMPESWSRRMAELLLDDSPITASFR